MYVGVIWPGMISGIYGKPKSRPDKPCALLLGCSIGFCWVVVCRVWWLLCVGISSWDTGFKVCAAGEPTALAFGRCWAVFESQINQQQQQHQQQQHLSQQQQTMTELQQRMVYCGGQTDCLAVRQAARPVQPKTGEGCRYSHWQDLFCHCSNQFRSLLPS